MLYRRGNIWWSEFMRGGKRQRVSTGLTDRAKAQQVADLLHLVARKRPPRASVDKWLDEIYAESDMKKELATNWNDCAEAYKMRSRAKPNVMKTTILQWKTFSTWAENSGINSPASVKNNDALRYIDSLDCAGKTKLNIISELKAVWGAACLRLPLPDKCPFTGLSNTIDTSDSKIRGAFTEDEVNALIKASETVHGGWWRLPIIIARWTGLRLSSIMALTWEEIDQNTEPWIMRHTPVKTQKHGIKVAVPIAHALRKELEKVSKNERSGKVVPMLRSKIPFVDVMRAAGVEEDGVRNFHSLRHSFRTALSAAGASDDIARRLGGWTNQNTADRYDHDERIAEKLAAIEGEVVGIA